MIDVYKRGYDRKETYKIVTGKYQPYVAPVVHKGSVLEEAI